MLRSVGYEVIRYLPPAWGVARSGLLRGARAPLCYVEPFEVRARHLERARPQIRAAQAAVRTRKRALAELRPRAHEGIPHHVVRARARHVHQRGRDGRVQRRGHVADAVGEAGVGHQLDPHQARRLVDLGLPRAPGVTHHGASQT
jgi:hypothetical protein